MIVTAVAGTFPGVGAAGTDTYRWTFLKRDGQTNGTLMLLTGCSTVQTWQAGSGAQGAGGMNECQKQVVGSNGTTVVHGGWLPNGSYYLSPWTAQWLNWGGDVVTGPVIPLPDKNCWNGTPRTELFVHSSYPWSGNHYYSEGCIKLSNTGGPAPASGEIADVVLRHYYSGQPNVLIVTQ
jgi:hypothetical protein